MHSMRTTGSICTVRVAGRRFGLQTTALAQVVRPRGLRRVPLCPGFICGVLPYRGEVLTVVGCRSLLEVPALADQAGCVLVMEGAEERFGLLVDEVGAVVEVETLEEMPAGVGARAAWLFGGVWRVEGELVARLEPERLTPARLRTAMGADGTMNFSQEAA